MIKAFICAAGIFFSQVVAAAEVPTPPDLPATPVARRALDTDARFECPRGTRYRAYRGTSYGAKPI